MTRKFARVLQRVKKILPLIVDMSLWYTELRQLSKVSSRLVDISDIIPDGLLQWNISVLSTPSVLIYKLF